MKTRKLVLTAFFIVLVIGFGYLSIQFPTQRFSFKFAAFALAGYMLGPIPTAFVGVVADFVGFYIKPMGYYHFGFALSALLTGLAYGLLKGKKDSRLFPWVMGVSSFITLFVNLVLNTLWLSQMYGKGWLFLLGPRILKEVIFLPIEIIIIRYFIKGLKPITERWTRYESTKTNSRSRK